MSNQNESITRRETATFRAVTGQSGNFPRGDGNITVDTFPSSGTIPIARAFTGTLSSSGKNVMGTGTLFETEGIKEGDYLYDDNGSVRKIESIINNTRLVLEQAFPSDASGIDVLVCEVQVFKRILWENTGTAAAVVQESPISAGAKGFNEGTPITYDATASNAQLEFTCTQ